MAEAPNPIAILDAGNFPASGYAFYELADPSAQNMDTTIVYAGVDPSSRNYLAERAASVSLGLLNPTKARWFSGLMYHVLLAEEPQPDPADRPAPELIPVRNELAASFAHDALKAFVNDNVHRPPATGVEAGWNLGKIHAALGERTAPNAWQAAQQEQLAVMLNDPGFNAILMARWLGHRFSPEDCVEGDPTTISIQGFIDTLNSQPRDSRDIFGDIRVNHYAELKQGFALSLFAWVKGLGNTTIFGEISNYYKDPEGFEPYL